MIGQTISHYRIVERLGEGGMGIVYVAEDTVLGRRVAIKTLTAARNSNDNHFRGRFLREARSISKLSHPHIATIYDYGETGDGQPYIVMELIKGETLSHLMEREALTIPRVIEIVEQVAEALAEAHRHGIIHRDIKPSNIAINERGDVKVLDFGLAKEVGLDDADSVARGLMNTQTREGVIVGTPMYLSPEQAMGVEVDERSDLFSLGSVLYECITGRPAFGARNQGEILARVIRDDPPKPSRLNGNVPRELDRITLKALAKKPEERYQTGAEMISDLRTAHANLQKRGSEQTVTRLLSSVSNNHPSSALATLSDMLRRPRLSPLMVLLALAIIGLVVLGIVLWRRPKLHIPSAEAQKLYDTGTEALRNGSFFQASKALELAIRSDDQFALAHARLAEALIELDYVDKSKDEMLRVSELTPDRSALPSIDTLYLDAITSTVRRDFAKAVEHYGEIVRLLPDQPYVLVDLGRAYEKNEQTDKAMEQYLAATSRDPLYATAFLRLGVLYGRNGKQADALAALSKADDVYQAQGKNEGRTEVLFQRGALFDKIGKVAEARDQLQQALNIARTSPNLYQQIQALIQLSSVAVDAGEIPQAQEYAREAVDLARNNGLENLTAGGLIDLGIVYLAHGDYGGAEESFKQALDFAQRNKGRGNEARASVMLGSLRLQQRNADEAQRYAKQALNFYQQGSYRKETSQAFLILGRASRLNGDYDAAFKVFDQQLHLAEQMSDRSLIASTHGEIGAVLEQQERYPQALEHYQLRYDISESINDEKGKSNALTNRAGMLWRLGRYDEAASSLDQAIKIADKPNGGFKAVLAAIYQYQGEIYLSQQNFRDAIGKSQQALTAAGDQYPDVATRAKRVIGTAQFLSGAKRKGRLLCEESLEIATKTKDPRLISTSLLALAEAQLVNGDASTALTSALHAQEGFAHSGQTDSEWHAWLIAARAVHQAGDEAKASEYGFRASEALATLEQRWGADSYKGYLSRNDIRFYHEQLTTELPVVK